MVQLKTPSIYYFYFLALWFMKAFILKGIKTIKLYVFWWPSWRYSPAFLPSHLLQRRPGQVHLIHLSVSFRGEWAELCSAIHLCLLKEAPLSASACRWMISAWFLERCLPQKEHTARTDSISLSGCLEGLR